MSTRRRRQRRAVSGLGLAHPRWWPTWLEVGLLWGIAHTPLTLQRALGRGIGRLIYALGAERRRITCINLRLCFPELDDHARERLVRQHFGFLGESVFEMAYSWWGPERGLRALARIVGREHLEAAQAQGRGVILLQGHFLTTDIAGQMLSMEFPLTATYAPPKNPVARYLTERVRARAAFNQIPHDQVRTILRALANNEIVWHGPDQGAIRGKGIPARFFGQPAQTLPATAKLARLSGAPVVPYHPIRLPDGRFELRIEPPLDDFPGADIAAATQRVNDTIERHARAAPAQYLWSHKRFKPARKHEPSPYR